jgi:hypothetical protein
MLTVRTTVALQLLVTVGTARPHSSAFARAERPTRLPSAILIRSSSLKYRVEPVARTGWEYRLDSTTRVTPLRT